MKTKNLFASIMAVGIFCVVSLLPCVGHGQSLYGQTTLLRILPPTALAQSSTTPLVTTSEPINISGFQGVCPVTLTVVSNSSSAAAALVSQLQSSPDGTNWTNVATAARSSQASLAMVPNTNGVFGVTNFYYNPGIAFTNTLNITNTGSTNFEFGVVLGHQDRYLRLTTTLTGSSAVYGVSAYVRGRRGTRYP